MDAKKGFFGFWLACSTLLISENVCAQVVGATQEATVITSEISNQEHVYLHHNSALLFAGEQLYYKMYALKSNSNALSTFSKIGYVELIGKDGYVVFRQKLRLDKGMGQGEFFIPVGVPSGSYKLLGYTQWMKNYGVETFFMSDLTIVNPFQSNKRELTDHPFGQANDSTVGYNLGNNQLDVNEQGPLSFSLDKKQFGTRERGILTIKGFNMKDASGNYSISIRKMDEMGYWPMPSAQAHFKMGAVRLFSGKAGAPEQLYLPELRGELISGKIVPKDPNIELKEEILALSIPGEQFVLKHTRSNDQGTFYFNLNHGYESSRAFVQVLGENKDKYEIVLNAQTHMDYGSLEFKKASITPLMTDLILKRSVYNQVENAFIEMKPDTLQPMEYTLPAYRNYTTSYDLDDYTRFSTIRETASEILEHVWVQKDNNGSEILRIRENDYGIKSSNMPLVVLDGILIQEHGDIIDFDAKRIKRINISREECVVNSIIYKGIIAMETLNGDFHQEYRKDFLHLMDLFSPLPSKRYFEQKYNTETKSSTDQIPDFRQQLLWLPNLILGKEVTKIDFFTSDIVGSYLICLEGFTNQGSAISLKETFVVE